MRASLQPIFASLSLATSALATETNSPTDTDAAYTRTINQRADKVVATLNLTNSEKAARTHAIIVQQYRDLNAVHTARDAQVKSATATAGLEKVAATTATQAARDKAKPKLDKLHDGFLARLSAELSPEQVDKVKDGMTYGVVPLTYGVYLKMYPELSDAQKQQIMAWLVEARELAMDGSTSDEKHAVFGKYKGKINNFLSKAGYDAKKGEQNLKKPIPSASDSKSR